jgi:Cu(I)/Ag(I) efflux system membrane protein CusA/SilA
MTYEKIVSELNSKLDFAGMPNIWWMPIQTRIEMLSTGVRTAVGVKVLGNDIRQIEEAAIAVETALKDVPGTRSAFAERSVAGSFIDISVKREAAALYGLNIADVQSIIDVALGGNVASTTVEGRERYGIQVRYARDFRDNLSALQDVIIPTPTGTQVKLGQIAEIGISSGSPMIASENGKVLTFVFVDVANDRGLSEYVNAAREVVSKNVKLPAGVRLEWSGQFEALERAKNTMLFVIPLALGIILVLLYLNTKSIVETAIVLLAVPFSLIGAFWLMWILGYKLSVASWVGLLALAGLDAETGVVMLLYLTRAYTSRIEHGELPSPAMLNAAIHEGAVQRVRPKLMTVAAALIGLLPVMWSSGVGSEVMKRIAAPMVGGVLTSGLLELLVYPAIFALWKEREMRGKN